jgi:hypothetical protein
MRGWATADGNTCTAGTGRLSILTPNTTNTTGRPNSAPVHSSRSGDSDRREERPLGHFLYRPPAALAIFEYTLVKIAGQ